MDIDENTAWEAIIASDTECDGQFFYGVKTTLIYCKPSCPSRNPLQKNIVLFKSSELAEENGFRACKRCKPQYLNQG